jgi:ADP-ribose pyrophosphatase YjhB (NUDIX family)
MGSLSGLQPARQVTRIAAYALCVEDGRILLCRIAPGWWGDAGRWTLPGGGLEFGESPEAGAIRELEEETGLAGTVRELADLQDWSGRWTHPRDGVDEAFHNIRLVYRVDVTGGQLRDEVDGSTDRAGWFTRDEAARLALVDLAETGIRLAFAETAET